MGIGVSIQPTDLPQDNFDGRSSLVDDLSFSQLFKIPDRKRAIYIEEGIIENTPKNEELEHFEHLQRK